VNLSSSVNWGLLENMDDSCGTTAINFPIKSKVAKLNESLDWYFGIAEASANNWNVDDTNNTSPPIDTQNIVSGTNRYKLTAFTEEILEILKLEVNGSSGNAKALIPETLDDFGNVLGNVSGQIGEGGNGSFDDTYVNAPSGTPTHYIKYGDFIYLRPKPDYNSTSGLKIYFNRPASKFSFVSCQGEADDELFTAASHGLTTNDTVIFEINSSGSLPTGLSADTEYYVIASGLTTSVFRVSATLGGSTINITTDGSNLHFLKTNKEPGIPSSHHPILYRKASALFMQSNNTDGVYNSRLQTILPALTMDEKTIAAFYANRDRDVRKRLVPKFQDNH
jgi:hypothetical protein